MRLSKTLTSFFVGIALVGTAVFVASPVQTNAQADASLQQMLQSIQKQLQQLQERVRRQTNTLPADSPADTDACSSEFTRNLSRGDTGLQVRQLQTFLNSLPSTQVAQSGPGSDGRETDYFGPLTESAVADFQATHASQILAPLGLEEPTGSWGPRTRQQANATCTQRTV